tara:strand:+ start:13908 stop:15014 length:1107 start_codon:yes stop_codon:yes gene_type:complete
MKTILHLIDTTGPGGAETVFINLLNELEGTDFRNVVVLRGEGWVADQVREVGIEPHFVDSKGSFNLGYIRALRRLLMDEDVDLIHAHLLGSNVYGALLALLARKPMIATFHGSVDVASRERFLRAKFSIIGWGASAIVCVSKGLQEQLSQRSPLPSRKLNLIFNGVDPERFSEAPATGLREELGLPPEAKLVVSIGNIRPAKGYEYLVDAAVEMAARDPLKHFVVVGHQRASLFNELNERISRAWKTPNIHWLGFRQDVESILRQADIFLLPSSSEGFSISTVEAMMARVPIIATRSGGPEEILVDGITGILIPTKDSDAIAGAIEKLDDSVLRERLTEKARADALQRFSLQIMLQEYKGLYERLFRG